MYVAQVIFVITFHICSVVVDLKPSALKVLDCTIVAAKHRSKSQNVTFSWNVFGVFVADYSQWLGLSRLHYSDGVI